MYIKLLLNVNQKFVFYNKYSYIQYRYLFRDKFVDIFLQHIYTHNSKIQKILFHLFEDKFIRKIILLYGNLSYLYGK